MEQETKMNLNDIADELLILNKHTIDTLFSLDNCADCVALYIFFYKTAKWQKTNSIKANEDYIKKCLGWGYDKIRKAKNTLKANGLIQMVQNRKDNKIEGWYIQVSYLVSQNSTDKIKVSNNTQKQEVGNPTSREQEINALKYNIKILEDNNKMLKEENNKLKELLNNKENIKENESSIVGEIAIPDKLVKDFTEKAQINKIFKFWNELGIIKHTKLNEARIKAIKKRLEDYSYDEIISAMNHYVIILHDENYYWNYTWSLEDFLNRKNGFTTFLDDGSNWVSYTNRNKNINNNNNPYSRQKEISKETAYPNQKNKGYI